MKKSICIMLIVCFMAIILMPVETFAGENPLVVIQIENPKALINTKIVDIEQNSSQIKPVLINNTTMVPLRFCVEMLGANVSWNQETKTAQITADNTNVRVTIGSKIVTVGDAKVTLESAPLTLYNRTFVPVRVISEALGYDVIWDNVDKTIFIGKDLAGVNQHQLISNLGDAYFKYVNLNRSKEEQILYFAKRYSPEGYYILSQSKNFMNWFRTGDFLRNLPTAVHEECHAYSMLSYLKGGARQSRFYLGDGKTVAVKHTDVFKTKEMASTIPQDLRTFRFDTYIGNADDYLAANSLGVYGLLDEFTAYYYGTRTACELYDYYMTLDQTPDNWFDYISNVSGQYFAHAEFRFYILKYLMYAKQNYPNIYKDIMANKEFKQVFNTIDVKFAQIIDEFFNKKQQIAALLDRIGYEAYERNGRFEIVKRDGSTTLTRSINTGSYDEQYFRLMEEMEKPEYQALIRELKS